MNIVKPEVSIVSNCDYKEAVRLVSAAARLCYKSNLKYLIEEEDFIRRLIKKGHHSVLEHYSISVKFIIDRGISHELVRHRLCAFSQESTRYCNYGEHKGGINIIHPMALSEDQVKRRELVLSIVEWLYNTELKEGLTPQIARGVLPTCLKTEIITTANIREWRHILNLRLPVDAHPQIREVMKRLITILHDKMGIFFEDIVCPVETNNTLMNEKRIIV